MCVAKSKSQLDYAFESIRNWRWSCDWAIWLIGFLPAKSISTCALAHIVIISSNRFYFCASRELAALVNRFYNISTYSFSIFSCRSLLKPLLLDLLSAMTLQREAERKRGKKDIQMSRPQWNNKTLQLTNCSFQNFISFVHHFEKKSFGFCICQASMSSMRTSF